MNDFDKDFTSKALNEGLEKARINDGLEKGMRRDIDTIKPSIVPPAQKPPVEDEKK